MKKLISNILIQICIGCMWVCGLFYAIALSTEMPNMWYLYAPMFLIAGVTLTAAVSHVLRGSNEVSNK